MIFHNNFSSLFGAEKIWRIRNSPAFLPRPLLRAGKFSRDFAKPFPPENSFVKTESAFRPAILPEYLEGRTPKEKHPFLFQKKFTPRQIRNARSVFLSGFPPSPRGGGGAIRRAYDLGQSHHALRACFIRGSAGNKSELFGIMTTSCELSA